VVDGCLERLAIGHIADLLAEDLLRPAASKYRRWVSMGRPNL
jgi:hypothetical protein